MAGKRTLVYGVGVNDADYTVYTRVDGKSVQCIYYVKWASMLKRCYSDKFHMTDPSYVGCEVALEWHSFMNFRSWMMTQDWQGNEIDKDLLIEGNKKYGPDTCLFVSKTVNLFIRSRNISGRGDYPTGVYFHKKSDKFAAQCNSLVGRRVHLGYFMSVEDAQLAYKSHKKSLAIELVAKQKDSRVSDYLISRYCA